MHKRPGSAAHRAGRSLFKPPLSQKKPRTIHHPPKECSACEYQRLPDSLIQNPKSKIQNQVPSFLLCALCLPCAFASKKTTKLTTTPTESCHESLSCLLDRSHCRHRPPPH